MLPAADHALKVFIFTESTSPRELTAYHSSSACVAYAFFIIKALSARLTAGYALLGMIPYRLFICDKGDLPLQTSDFMTPAHPSHSIVQFRLLLLWLAVEQ
jgi:hypothetical protein